MSAISSSLGLSPYPRLLPSPRSSLKPLDQRIGSASKFSSSYFPKNLGTTSRRPLVVEARVDGRADAVSIFVGGFVLGGAVVGALGLIFAPQLSMALVGENRKKLLKKLPFYDEEKVMERNPKMLADKIEQLDNA